MCKMKLLNILISNVHKRSGIVLWYHVSQAALCSLIVMQLPGSMYFGETCECNNFQCGVDTRGRLCSGKGGVHAIE